MTPLQRRSGKAQTVPDATRKTVFARSGYACEMCGFTRDDADPYVPGARVRLTVGYISPGLKTGLNKPQNLRTLCHNCSDGLQGVSILPRPTRIELLTFVRRATVENQKHLLFWLRAKHRSQFQA